MNKIFKTLKNHRTGAATAVSELQTGRTKGSRLKATVLAVALLSALTAGSASAQIWSNGANISLRYSHRPDNGTTNVEKGFAFGKANLAAKTYGENVDVWACPLTDKDGYVFHFEGFEALNEPIIKLNLDDKNSSLSLFEQSQGFDQALVQTTGLSVSPGAKGHFSVSSVSSDKDVIENLGPDEDPNIIEQLFEQKGDTIASGRYIIGERAQNLDSAKKWEGYDHGIKYDSTTFYTATVLSELDIYEGKMLELGVSGQQKWGAHLTGEGGVTYVGDSDNKAENVVTIKQLFESNQESDKKKDRLDLANDYKGATTVTNVTLNLERETSLGASGILTAYNANIVEVKGGALGTLDTIDFTNTELTTKDMPLAVTGATFEGTNVLNVTGIFEVDGAAEISKGSLTISDKSNTTGRALFSADSLKLDGAKLTASSASVSGDSTVSGESSLDIGDNKFDVDGMLTLTSGGSLTAQGIAIEAGDLTIDEATLDSGDVTVTGTTKVESGTSKLTGGLQTGTLEISESGYLTGVDMTASVTMLGNKAILEGEKILTNELRLGQDTEISAKRFEVTETVDFGAGDHDITTTEGAFFKQDVTVAENGSVSFTGGDATVDGDLTVGKKSRLSADTISVKGTVSFRDTSSLSVTKDLWVGQALTIEGEYRGNSDDNKYTYEVNTQALDDRSGYDVTIRNLDAVYDANATMTGVKTTKLDNASLELPYANTAKLGSTVVMVGDGGNLLTFKADDANPGFILDGRFVVREEGLSTGPNLGTRNVVEFKGLGRAEDTVTFTNNAFAGDDYNGWIRMTGTTVDLADALSYDSGLSLSIGRGGTIVYDESVVGSVHRLGWTSEGDSELSAGVLDLSGVDFAQLDENEAVLKVQELVVSGPGTILLNKSAVQNIGTSGAAQGDDIFDAISGGDSRLVIKTITGHDQEYYGSIDVKVEGADQRPLTGFFDADGKFTGDTFGAARGTWGYTTKFSNIGLGLTYSLDKLELLAKNTQEGVGAFTLDTTQLTEHTDFGVTLTGSGDLNVEGTATGTLHLTGANTMKGTVYVKSGTLMAEAGSLGSEKEHASLDVAKGAEFQLNGGQNERKQQYLRSLNSKGDVTIGNDAVKPNDYELKLTLGGTGSTSYFQEGSTLDGTENAVLAVANGHTLEVTDLGNVASDYKGVISVDTNAVLRLKDSDDMSSVDLSLVEGSGTIELRDSAIYAKDQTRSFTGITKVLAGGKLDITADAKVDAGARLVMDGGESREAEIVSGKKSTFETIDLKNGTIDLGVATAGQDRASGSLNALGQVTLENVTLSVNTEHAAASKVDASGIFELGNSGGKTTWLLTGESVVIGNGVTIEGIETDSNKPYTSELTQYGVIIGSVTHTLKEEFDKNGIGFTTKASAIDLTDELKLAGSLDAGADSTLELQVTGSKSGSIRVTNNKVTLAAENTYGKLVVDDKAEAELDKKQTLMQGGLISGKVSGEGGLDVTGGTLTVSETGSSNVAIRLDAEDKTAGAELAFVNRKGSSVIYAGDVSGVSGARVSFADTTGDFSLASGTADYVLSGTSAVTFGPYADESALKDTFTLKDAVSTAYLNIKSAAKSIDLSGVTGNGKLALNYADAGGTLNVAEMNAAFKGTLAFANATATIGTDESVKASKLNRFATEQGELEVGAGSTLAVNNLKDRAADGSFTPHAVELAGDLTISDRATLDFTAGVFEDHGTEHLGNSSGLSVNALDLNGNRFVVVNSGEDSKITVQARIDKLDFGTGLPSNGEYHGSILDMLGETPDYPVLTVIENIRLDGPDKAAAISAIASSMVLEGVDEDDEKIVKFWQPNWDPESEHETVYVANVTTGVKLVGVKNENDLGNIAIGAGITKIDIVQDATLRMDEAASAPRARTASSLRVETATRVKPGSTSARSSPPRMRMHSAGAPSYVLVRWKPATEPIPRLRPSRCPWRRARPTLMRML